MCWVFTSKYIGDYLFAGFISYNFPIKVLRCPPKPFFWGFLIVVGIVVVVVVVNLPAIPANCFILYSWPRIESAQV